MCLVVSEVPCLEPGDACGNSCLRLNGECAQPLAVRPAAAWRNVLANGPGHCTRKCTINGPNVKRAVLRDGFDRVDLHWR
jgi:hypothetical protein